jgi:hypothetical protein
MLYITDMKYVLNSYLTSYGEILLRSTDEMRRIHDHLFRTEGKANSFQASAKERVDRATKENQGGVKASVPDR